MKSFMTAKDAISSLNLTAVKAFEKPVRLKPAFKLIFSKAVTSVSAMFMSVSAADFIIYPRPAFNKISVPLPELKKLPAAEL